MKKNILGNTGFEVTEICFGCLPFGPLQKNLPVEEAAEILSLDLDMGINFIDTAQMYRAYDHIKMAFVNRKDKPIIATKSLCGDTLVDDYEKSMEFSRNLSDDFPIAIGMVSK